MLTDRPIRRLRRADLSCSDGSHLSKTTELNSERCRATCRHGRLVRTDKLSPLRVGIVARHGSLRSIFTFSGVGIVLKRFAGADKLPLFPVWIVLQCGSLGSVFVSLGVRIVLRL